MAEKIPFNLPYASGKELEYIAEAIKLGHLSGDGAYTKQCQAWFTEHCGFKHTILTSSCTDALEMSALLLGLEPGDEVILPSFTFVSTATAFALRGAKLVFADSLPTHPNLDPEQVSALITPRTRAIVVVHYAGMACDMDAIMAIAARHGLPVVEDAAQAFQSTYRGKLLGTFGSFATLSFHETKNIISGEGGLLIINDKSSVAKAEIMRDKGTDRAAFFRGQVDKYRWVGIGSSFLPSEIIAAYLFAQLECSASIQSQRLAAWNYYQARLRPLVGQVELPSIPEGASNNGHLFHLVCRDLTQREALRQHLNDREINAVIHYQALHQSPYVRRQGETAAPVLPQAERYSDCLLRLPLFCEITRVQQDRVCDAVLDFFNNPA
jgi:dTDP-4-amino-4,6-dideoxygalactose transaminase